MARKKEVDFAKINSSYRHYRHLYDVTRKFNKPGNRFFVWVSIQFVLLFNFLGGHRIATLFFKSPQFHQKERTLAFVFSKNHMTVLRSLRKNGINIRSVHIGNNTIEEEQDLYVSNKQLFIEALKVPNAGKILKQAKNDSILGKNFTRIIKLVGCWKLYEGVLDSCSCIINFNDHTPYCVLLQDMAKEKGKGTIYMQHASVSYKFPALYHDHNILFSKDSIDKYKKMPHAQIYELFDLRFSLSGEKKVKDAPTEKKVLICTNLLDDTARVAELTTALIEQAYQVTIRPHPSDNRRIEEYGIAKISQNQSIWTDIEVNGIVIANESAVMLEAIYLDRLVYKASFFSEPFDNYSYLKKKLLLKEHFSLDSLLQSLTERAIEFDKEKLNYFVGDISNTKERLHNIFKDIFKKETQKRMSVKRGT